MANAPAPKVRFDPRERFNTVPGSKTWTDVVDSELFQRAVEAAMVQLTIAFPSAVDMGQSAANGFRMEGARMFVNTLMRLTEARGSRPVPTVGLNYNA